MKLSGWRQWTMLVVFALVVTVTGLFAGSLTWVVAGAVFALILGWQLAKYFRPDRPTGANNNAGVKSEAV